jgi:hypothetical protein
LNPCVACATTALKAAAVVRLATSARAIKAKIHSRSIDIKLVALREDRQIFSISGDKGMT